MGSRRVAVDGDEADMVLLELRNLPQAASAVTGWDGWLTRMQQTLAALPQS